MIEINKVSKLNFMSSDSIQPKNKKISEHENTVCSNCGGKTTNNHWYKRRDENGNWNGEYICKVCYSNSACRSGELDPNSNTYKGMIGVQTVAKVLGNKDCTIMKEGSPFDICSIQSIKYGKVEVKTATYNSERGYWTVSGIKLGLFDTLFIICTNSKFENVIRIYIISGIEVGNVSSIAIYKDHFYIKYEEFRVNDITQYRKAFQIVKNESQISKNYVDNGQSFMNTKEKGDICEEIVKIAINAKTSTDIRYDLVHSKYKRIEVKGSDYILRHEKWFVGDIESFKFDTLFIVCMSSNFERVGRVYIIPKGKVNVSGITIFENPKKVGWYEEFRVDEEPYQDVYEKILENDML